MLELTHSTFSIKRSSPWNQPRSTAIPAGSGRRNPEPAGRPRRLHGRTVAFGVAPIETTYPRPTWAEQEPLQWWTAARDAVAAALAQGNVDPEQIAGDRPRLHGLHRRGLRSRTASRCVPPCSGWISARSARPTTISATGDPILRYVSGRVSPEWMLPKALWLKRHEPERLRPGRPDRRVHRLDDVPPDRRMDLVAEPRRGQVELRAARRRLAGRPLKAVGLGDLLEKWPDADRSAGQRRVRLERAAARELGLGAGTPVAQGGIDAYLGMLGLGATQDGDVAVIVGSSTCHLAQSRDGVFGSGAAGCYPDATVEGLYTLEAGQTATGSILDWYRRHFAGFEQQEAEERGVNVFQVLDEQAAAVPPGAEGLVVRDDWQGNRSPYKNPQARGAIVGLSLAHGPGHIFRAIYEATACGTRHILEDASAHGLKVERIFLGGGGARSALWLQIHADILKKPVHLARESEACARWARPWPPPSPPASIPISTRPPAPWSPSRRPSSPTRPTRAFTTNSSVTTSISTRSSARADLPVGSRITFATRMAADWLGSVNERCPASFILAPFMC